MIWRKQKSEPYRNEIFCADTGNGFHEDIASCYRNIVQPKHAYVYKQLLEAHKQACYAQK